MSVPLHATSATLSHLTLSLSLSLSRARRPYTRTEQDVLESLLPPSVGRGADIELIDGKGDGRNSADDAAFGRLRRTIRRSRRRRRLQEEEDGASAAASQGAAFTTPDVVLPAHLHYFYHGCDRHAARDVMHPLPRKQCLHGGQHHEHQSLVAGRVVIEGGGAGTSSSSAAAVGVSGVARALGADPAPGDGGMRSVAIEDSPSRCIKGM